MDQQMAFQHTDTRQTGHQGQTGLRPERHGCSAGGDRESEDLLRAAAVRCMHEAVGHLSGLQLRGLPVPELKTLASLAGRLKTSADSLLCRIAAEVDASGAGASPQGLLQQTTNMSKRDANRTTSLGIALESMPNVAGRLADGAITPEHAKALTETAKHTSTEAVDANTALLNRAEQVPPDLFANDAKRFADQHSADRGESEYRRQRRRRSLSMFTADDGSGMGRLSGWLDPVSFGLVRQAIDGHASMLKRQDDAKRASTRRRNGSAAGQAAGERRSAPQRRADALVELTTDRDALTLQVIDVPGGTTAADVDSVDSTESRPDRGKSHASTQLVVVANLGLLDGSDPDGRCEIPGTGPVPPSILRQLSPNTKLTGIIFSGDGQPLWLGRARRRPNAHQQLAVSVRDGGCVQCAAPMHQCEIHHVLAWEHDGSTDVENLQALCGQHHHQHHAHHDHARGVGSRRGARSPRGSDSRREPNDRPPPKRPTPTRPSARPRGTRSAVDRSNGGGSGRDRRASAEDPP